MCECIYICMYICMCLYKHVCVHRLKKNERAVNIKCLNVTSQGTQNDPSKNIPRVVLVHWVEYATMWQLVGPLTPTPTATPKTATGISHGKFRQWDNEEYQLLISDEEQDAQWRQPFRDLARAGKSREWRK